MKMTTLSLITAMAISTAFAGGDIAPAEPAAEMPQTVAETEEACNSNTTINGKAVAYYYTDDSVDLFDEESSNLGTAVTVDVSHKLLEGITANFSAVGFTNLLDEYGYMEAEETGAFFNVANITATFADTTLVAGRQLLDTPMVGGFDWLLAPGSFEAYTLVNGSIPHVTLVGSYLAKWRPNNSGTDFIDLTDIDDGENYAFGAAYSNAFDASIWYYNVDAGAAAGNPDKFTQIYADAGFKAGDVSLAAQYVTTDYDMADDSDAYGVKISASVAGLDLMAAYNKVEDNTAGFVGRDGLYASSWNTFAAASVGDNYKIEAATELNGLSATASYAAYAYDNGTEEGHEIDVILGYGVTDCFSLDAVYSNTDYGDGIDIAALELVATYQF
ncbi:MAG: hypothetical protein ABXS92_00350 [Sulfurimonas sp.]